MKKMTEGNKSKQIETTSLALEEMPITAEHLRIYRQHIQVKRFFAWAEQERRTYADLIRHDLQIAFLLAKDFATPREVLVAFSTSKEPEIIKSLARNPSMPTALLEKMFLRKRGGDWTGFVFELAQNPACPVRILKEMGTQKGWSYAQYSIAGHPRLPVVVMQQIIDSGDTTHIGNLARNPSLPEHLFKRLLVHPYPYVRADLATRLDLHVSALALMSKDPHERVRQHVAENPYTPPSILASLCQDLDSFVRSAAAHNPRTPLKVVLPLANDPEGFVRYGVAMHPRVPAAVLDTLKADSDHFARQYVASHKNTSPDALAFMANDALEHVRERVAENPNTPIDALEKLLADPSEKVTLRAATNRSLSMDSMRKAVSRGSGTFRGYLAQNRNAPDDVLIALSKAPELFVRANVLLNLKTPADVRSQLMQDEKVSAEAERFSCFFVSYRAPAERSRPNRKRARLLRAA